MHGRPWVYDVKPDATYCGDVFLLVHGMPGKGISHQTPLPRSCFVYEVCGRPRNELNHTPLPGKWFYVFRTAWEVVGIGFLTKNISSWGLYKDTSRISVVRSGGKEATPLSPIYSFDLDIAKLLEDARKFAYFTGVDDTDYLRVKKLLPYPFPLFPEK